MQFIKRHLFTIIGLILAFIVLAVDKLGDYFLLAPGDMFYIDVVVAILLIVAGCLLDVNLHKLAREKKIERELRRANEKLDETNRALRKSLARVKVLSGLLPICASCKKVRDDKGYWRQLESYLYKHSEAEFAHWLCPECIEQLWHKSHRKREAT
jgi:hypothetical protein